MTPYGIRRAVAADEPVIKALVRKSNINPLGIHWQRFLVAEDAGRIVGIGQIKVHGDASRELASIATVSERQGEGIASAIIKALLSMDASASSAPLYLTCRAYMRPFYERFGFRPVAQIAGLPPYFRRLMRIVRVFWGVGRLFGSREGGLIMVRDEV